MSKRNKGIELGPEMIGYLWRQLVIRLGKNAGLAIPEDFLDKPEELWKDQSLRKSFVRDLEKRTTHKISKIVLIRYEEDEITEDYLNNHFVKKNQNKFQPGYLDRFAFYLTQGKLKYWNDFQKTVSGISGLTPERSVNEVLPGLKKLEGYWIGLNKNINDGRYLKCRYRIWQDSNVMRVEREGYNNEICFHGQIIMQEDSSFAFLLHGRERKRFKQLIANPSDPEAETLKCIATAMSNEHHRPVIVKEYLYKVPKVLSIGTGEVLKFEDLEADLKNDFGERDISAIFKELIEFLGESEASVFSMEDFSRIKSYHLKDIKKEENVPSPLSRSVIMPYLEFDKAGKDMPFPEPLQQKKIVNFYRDKKNNLEKGIQIGREIYEDYIFMKILSIKLDLQLNILFNFRMKFLKR